MAVTAAGSTVWGTADVAVGSEQRLSLGDLTVVLRREPKELWVRHEYGGVQTDPRDDDGWTRWAASREDRYELRPALPDRSIVVSPERPFHLPPHQRSRIYVRVPLFARLTRIAKGEAPSVLEELPSVVLSDTWWGDFVEGELAYWVLTRARRAVTPDLFEPHLALCPFSLVNGSDEPLPVVRFAVRVAYLTLFGRGEEVWTDEVRVSYDGAERGSEIDYTGRVVDEAKELSRLAEPRQPAPRGLHMRTFGKLRALSGGW